MNEGEETNTYDPDYDDTSGDGHTLDDIQVDENGNIFLRAERSGAGFVGRHRRAPEGAILPILTARCQAAVAEVRQGSDQVGKRNPHRGVARHGRRVIARHPMWWHTGALG